MAPTVDRRLSEIHEQLRKLTTNRPSSRGSDTPSSTPQESPAARWLEEAKSAASSPEDSAQARCVGFAPSEESARWRHERRGSIPEDEAIEAPTPPPPPAVVGGVTRKAGGVALEVSVGSRGGARASRRTFTPHERKGPRLPKSCGGTPQRPSPAARAEGGTPSRAAGVAAASAASAPLPRRLAPRRQHRRRRPLVRRRRAGAAAGARGGSALREQQRLSRPSGDDGPSAVSCVALDEGGGCAVTGAEDGALALWVRDEGGGGWRLGAVTNAHDDEVESVAMRGALVLSGGGDGKVHAWRLDAEGELLWKLRTLLSVKGDGEVGVLSLAMPPADGGGGGEADCAWAVCGAQDGRIRVVATAGGTETQALRVRGRRPGAAWVYSLALGDGGGGASLLLGGTFEGLCALWRAPAAAEPRAPPTFVLERELRPFSDDPNTDGVLSVALNAARGWAAAGTNDGVVRVWAVGGDAQPLASEPAATAGVCALAWRGEGGDELLSGAEDGSCTVWRLAGGGGTLACAQRLTALADHAAEANSIASTAEGDALLVSRASGVLEVYG